MVFKPFNVTKESTKLQLNLGLQQKKDVQTLLLILALQLQNYSDFPQHHTPRFYLTQSRAKVAYSKLMLPAISFLKKKSLSGLVVLEELGNKQTHKLTH